MDEQATQTNTERSQHRSVVTPHDRISEAANDYVIAALSLALKVVKATLGTTVAEIALSPALHLNEYHEELLPHFYVTHCHESERERAVAAITEAMGIYGSGAAAILSAVIEEAGVIFGKDDVAGDRVFIWLDDDTGAVTFLLDVCGSPGCAAHDAASELICRACHEVDDAGMDGLISVRSEPVTRIQDLLAFAHSSAPTWRTELRRQWEEDR